MMNILFMLYMVMVMSLLLSISPLVLGVWLFILAFLVGMYLMFFISSWSAMVMFIIFVSGILVMFSYFLALYPNQSLDLFIPLLGISISMMYIGVVDVWVLKMFIDFSSSVSSMLILDNLFLFGFLILMLLIAMITVVTLTRVSGSLRSFM